MIGRTFTWDYLLIWLWLAGTLLLSVLFIFKYIRSITKIKKIATAYVQETESVLAKVADAVGKQINVRVLTAPGIESPMGLGIFKKTILLPAQEYSEDELFFILLHEVTHFLNRDIPLKLLIQFYCIIFWWNPVIYLLRKDLNQILEIKCDLAVVSTMDKKKKISYLLTIVNVIKDQGSPMKPNGFESVSIVGNSLEANLVERFKIVSDEKASMGRLMMKAIWYFGAVCIILTSYLFVIQPKYSPPEEDIVTEEGSLDISHETAFIMQQSNKNYLLIHNSGYELLIDNETAQEMIEEGFELKKGE